MSLVQREQAVDVVSGVEGGECVGLRCGMVVASMGVVGEQSADCVGEFIGAIWIDEQSRPTVVEHLDDAS